MMLNELEILHSLRAEGVAGGTALAERAGRGGDLRAFARPRYYSYHDIWTQLRQHPRLIRGREQGVHDEG
ncbi:hypothetical protein [Nocardia nova]|nr:hypothetical protein [Nocardia nova]